MPLKPSAPDAVVLRSAVRPGSLDAAILDTIPAEIVAAEGHRLAQKIGPLAKIIAERAAENARDLAEFNTTLAAAIPDARFVALEGQNHLILEDDPAWPRFLAEVREFLAQDEV